MATNLETKARVTGHNGMEHTISYTRYYGAATKAKQAEVDGVLKKAETLKGRTEREITLDILGHGESIAPTE